MLGMALGAAAPFLIPAAIRAAPQIGRGAQALWRLGRGMGTPAGRAAAADAARGLGPRIYGPGRPGHTPIGAAAPRGPGGRFTGPRPSQPPMPPGLLNRAGPAMQQWPWYGKVGAGLGAGAGLEALMMSDPEAEEIPGTPGMTPGLPGMVPGGPAPFTSDLPSYTERAEANRSKLMNNMSTIIKHSMLLQFQNPGRKNSYMKDAIEMIKMTAMQDNEVEVARMIDEVFKDKKVPKTAKTIYNRMLTAGASPAEAANVSGYTLEIEKTEAEAAADYARSQPQLSDIYSKPALMMKTVQDAYQAGQAEEAIQQLSIWLKTEVIKMPDAYARYQPKTDQDYYQLAAAILSGQGTAGVAQPTGEIGAIRVK